MGVSGFQIESEIPKLRSVPFVSYNAGAVRSQAAEFLLLMDTFTSAADAEQLK